MRGRREKEMHLGGKGKKQRGAYGRDSDVNAAEGGTLYLMSQRNEIG